MLLPPLLLLNCGGGEVPQKSVDTDLFRLYRRFFIDAACFSSDT